MRHRLCGILLVALMWAGTAKPQNTDIEALAGLQFNFGNPGARSLGMGGAFLGLADDASAAEANPAGLTALRKTEVSVEGRDTTTAQNFVTGGTYPHITRQDFPSRQSSVAFVSLVVPFRSAALAIYRHDTLRFRNEVDIREIYTTPVYYVGPNGPMSEADCALNSGCTRHQIYPFATAADVELQTWGASLAWKWNTLSLGGSVRYHQFRETAYTHRVDLDAPGIPTFVIAQNHGSSLYGRKWDTDVTWVAGAKWSPTSHFSLGAVYKPGASFPAPVSARVEGQPGDDMQTLGQTEFHVPDQAGVGISLRPLSNLTLNLDAIRVDYSNLTDHFISVIEYSGSSDIEQVLGYRAEDGTELHGGVEYFILGRVPVAVRAGLWRDPPHGVDYAGPLSDDHETAAAILFPKSETAMHYSVGIGIALPHFQIDAGYDTSERLKVASVSIVARY